MMMSIIMRMGTTAMMVMVFLLTMGVVTEVVGDGDVVVVAS